MAAKATTIKEAIKKWEEKTGQQAATATEVSLVFQWPPIEKMDNTLATLTECEKLSLSTNTIEKVTGLTSLKKLRILSLGRNYIKSFAGMECLGETLQELWISYNLVEKLKGIHVLRNLRVLYMSNNLVKEWSEFNKLQRQRHVSVALTVLWRGWVCMSSAILNPCAAIPSTLLSALHLYAATCTCELPHLEDLLFVGNPLYDACELETWRAEVARRLPNLNKLDGETVIREDEPPLTVADMQPDGGDGVETLVSAETND